MSRLWSNESRLLAVLVALWSAGRLLSIWSGWPETAIIADDAYYYFTIARNLANGLGPTFDGLAPTNGFHPLWQLLLVPVFALFAGDDLWIPVRVALTVSSVFDLLSALLIHRCLRLLVGGRRALLGAVLWLLLPFTFLIALRGMEASVSTFLVLGVFWLLCRNSRSGSLQRGRYALAVGLALGLCGLARTDNLPVVGLALAATVAWGVGRAWTMSSRVRWLSTVAGVSLAVMAPWFAWNVSRFHSLIQVSGQVKLMARSHFYGALPWRWHDLPSALSTIDHMLLSPILAPIRFLSGEEYGSPVGSAVLGPLTAGLLLGLLVPGWRRSSRELHRHLVFLLGILGVHAFLFGVVWRAYASWYALPSLAALILLVAALGPAPRGSGWRDGVRWCAAGLVGVSLLLWVLVTVTVPHGARGPERRFEPLFQQVVRELPRGVVLGAFDAGALGYVAGGYDGFVVTNLDCLVNNAAFAALQQGRYREYLIENVDFLLQDAGRARMFLERDEVEELRHHYRKRASSP